jgi:GLPGLI family protein
MRIWWVMLLVGLSLYLQAQVNKLVYCLAQQPFSGMLKYSQITAFEDTTRKNLVPVEMVFTQEESIATQGMIQKMDKNDPSRVLSAQIEPKKKYAVYINLKTNRMMSRQKADTELVIVDDVLDKIVWKMLPQTRKIGNLKCQRAEAMVRGRFYTAWFAPEIPVRFGPWKLHGLPGLIVQAKSADNAVEFRFESLKMPADDSYKIAPLEALPNMKTVNEKGFLERKKQNEENFLKMLKADPITQKGTIVSQVKWIEIYPEK